MDFNVNQTVQGPKDLLAIGFTFCFIPDPTLQNCSIHIDSFYDLFMNFLKRQSFSCISVNGETESPQISSKISSFVFSVLETNESLTNLE